MTGPRRQLGRSLAGHTREVTQNSGQPLPVLATAETPDSDLRAEETWVGAGVLTGPQGMSQPYHDTPRLNSYGIHLGKHAGSGEGSLCSCPPESPGIWGSGHGALREVREPPCVLVPQRSCPENECRPCMPTAGGRGPAFAQGSGFCRKLPHEGFHFSRALGCSCCSHFAAVKYEDQFEKSTLS